MSQVKHTAAIRKLYFWYEKKNTNLLIAQCTLLNNKFHQFMAALQFQVTMMSHGSYALSKHVPHL